MPGVGPGPLCAAASSVPISQRRRQSKAKASGQECMLDVPSLRCTSDASSGKCMAGWNARAEAQMELESLLGVGGWGPGLEDEKKKSQKQEGRLSAGQGESKGERKIC